MNVDLQKMLEAFRLGQTEQASIHLKAYLESRVRTLLKGDVVSEDFGNVKTRTLPGAPDGGATVPNVFTTKTIPTKKKKLPTLAKGKHGTGIAPAGWHNSNSNTGESDGGGEGGGGE
ncbi:hypothetical protein Xoosp13_277 [Xanthomonas phage Xoo-sp13]|nr:hypothetical protein Xoosp13_277 [Xanthomonas phage Xoo-sp13]